MLLKLMFILVILIGLGFLGLKLSNSTSLETLQVTLDEATKTAIDKGEFKVPAGVIFVEPKDCEGTQWIKQSGCSLDGKEMDGTEGSCGAGKELWILDPEHPNFKPATGGGTCEPQERECSVPCPKPCEGDTWTKGACVRKEIRDGAIFETILDGTAGKCGDGITTFNLDTKASDYKPAVGTGACVVEKGGACNIPCPKPEPPKCVEYTPGWQKNDMGCVRSQTDLRKVLCGQKGTRNEYRIPLDAKNCPELTRWVDCTGDPCPVNCEGSWSDWSDPKSDEPCGVQPYRERVFTITTKAAHGGYACDYPHGDTEQRNAGSSKTCCEETGDWAMVGACNADGTAKYTQTYKENKVGGCPSTAKAKFMACCFQKGDWKDTTGCSSVGRKTQTQTTVNCPESVKTRQVDCPYVGPWVPIGGCGPDGKQYYRRDVINSGAATSKAEDCCYTSAWTAWGSCQSNGKQKATRSVTSACTGANAVSSKEQNCCYEGNEWRNVVCNPNNSAVQHKTLVNCSKPYAERTAAGACNYQKCSVQTWKHDNFRDWTWTINDTLPDVSATGSRHDEITSYAKYGNCKATAYEHPNYGGWAYTLQEGRHNVPGWVNDRISSIKIEHLPYNL